MKITHLILLFALCVMHVQKAAAAPEEGSLACASLVYSLPGAPFMHKLVACQGEQIKGVDLSEVSTLSLHDDRATVGNAYLYVAGNAPLREGEYTYKVQLADADGRSKEAPVRLVVSSFLQSPRPMMSWLTWNWFARSISHDRIVDIADGLKRHGLIDAGFRTIVLDDAWAAPSTDKAALTYDKAKFPQGISGLKKALLQTDDRLILGIYSDAGLMTCEDYQPGSYLYERQHLKLFADWGVDMLKYDYCNAEASTQESYSRMGEAVAELNVQRRQQGLTPFVLNICEWGKTQPWLWGAEAGGSSWRATSDAREDWIGNNSRPGVIAGVDEVRRLWMYAGVNRFNDLDMMCIGLHGLGGPSNNTVANRLNGGVIEGLTDAQARTQMSLWCMLASPLALTCDLRAKPACEANTEAVVPPVLITSNDIATLTNPYVIAINQDPLGQQAEYMEQLSTGSVDYSDQGYDVFLKDLSGGRFALSVTNRSLASQPSVSLPLSQLYMSPSARYDCHDVWANTRTTVSGALEVGSLAPCETRVFVLTLVR